MSSHKKTFESFHREPRFREDSLIKYPPFCSVYFEKYFYEYMVKAYNEGNINPLIYEHYVPVKKDLSDLIYIIQWCIKHDKECSKIAESAYTFYEKYLTKDGIFDYLQHKMNTIYCPEYNISYFFFILFY